MPCKGGYRDRIEAAKARSQMDRLERQGAAHRYWLDLVERAHASPGGHVALPPHELTYFALGCLMGEVCNGGFHQFFFNHAGAMYGAALAGLLELEAEHAASLLMRAKDVLFGQAHVPTDTAVRRGMLCLEGVSLELTSQLDGLDQAFYANMDDLAARCTSYAVQHGLFGG